MAHQELLIRKRNIFYAKILLSQIVLLLILPSMHVSYAQLDKPSIKKGQCIPVPHDILAGVWRN